MLLSNTARGNIGASGSVAIGPLSLAAPPSCTLLLASHDRERVERFVATSPDRTVYHERPFVAFAAADQGAGDLLLCEEQGDPRFAVPIYAVGADGIDTGYSGLALPAATAERPIRRGVAAFFALLRANSHLRYARCTRAVVSAGGMDPERRSLIDYAWSASAPRRGSEVFFTRVLPLPVTPGATLPARCEAGVAGHDDGRRRDEGARRRILRPSSRGGARAATTCWCTSSTAAGRSPPSCATSTSTRRKPGCRLLAGFFAGAGAFLATQWLMAQVAASGVVTILVISI